MKIAQSLGIPFLSPIVTTPFNEWSITELNKIENANLRHERRIPNIDELMGLEITKQLQPKQNEVLASVLSTAPMVSFFPFKLNRTYCQQNIELTFSFVTSNLQHNPPPISLRKPQNI
jgi:hypothetical protein